MAGVAYVNSSRLQLYSVIQTVMPILWMRILRLSKVKYPVPEASEW